MVVDMITSGTRFENIISEEEFDLLGKTLNESAKEEQSSFLDIDLKFQSMYHSYKSMNGSYKSSF